MLLSPRESAADSRIEHAKQMRALRPSTTPQVTRLAAMFPAVAKSVWRGGWIEIGEQEQVGFIIRPLNEGGLVSPSGEIRSVLLLLDLEQMKSIPGWARTSNLRLRSSY